MHSQDHSVNMRTFISILTLALSGVVHSTPLPYNETADAKLDVQQALATAKPAKQMLDATRAGELSSARRMSDNGVYHFFHGAASAKAR